MLPCPACINGLVAFGTATLCCGRCNGSGRRQDDSSEQQTLREWLVMITDLGGEG